MEIQTILISFLYSDTSQVAITRKSIIMNCQRCRLIRLFRRYFVDVSFSRVDSLTVDLSALWCETERQ